MMSFNVSGHYIYTMCISVLTYLLTYVPTYLHTAWSRVLLEKLTFLS